MACSFYCFGRRCRVIPRVPWWLENPVPKHPDIVFDQNLIKIDKNPIRPMLFLAAHCTNDVIGTKRLRKCVIQYVLCRMCDNQSKFAQDWLAINFILFICSRMSFILKKWNFHDSFSLNTVNSLVIGYWITMLFFCTLIMYLQSCMDQQTAGVYFCCLLLVNVSMLCHCTVSWHRINLPDEHLPYYFFSRSELKSQCLASSDCPFQVPARLIEYEGVHQLGILYS